MPRGWTKTCWVRDAAFIKQDFPCFLAATLSSFGGRIFVAERSFGLGAMGGLPVHVGARVGKVDP